MGMFFGVTSVAAQATGVTVQGTVKPCEISISSTEPVDLGPASYDHDKLNFVFQDDAALSLSWHANGAVCAGALYASRTEIVQEEATAVTGSTSLTITSFDVDVDGEGESPVDVEAEIGVTVATPVEIKTPSASGGDETFGVKMLIPLTSPAGVYSSIVTFTVVVE
jgi:hypothetical protein